MVGKLLKDTNNMAKLEDLNDYIDKIEVKPRRNLISAYDLEIQIPKPANISKNSSAKFFLKETQAC